MAKFTARFDERTSAMLDDLSRSEGVPKSHVIRRAVVLLQRAVEARDAEDRVVREILL